jgi:hypothetical protein
MNKIIEYASVIYYSGGEESLERMVNDKIQQGFQPYGYPCVAGATMTAKKGDHQDSDLCIVQAMVKYEDDRQPVPNPIYKSK